MLAYLVRKWKTLFGEECRPPAGMHRHRSVLRLEALEERALLSIQVVPGYVYGPTDLGVRQWTQDLTVVGDQRILDGPYGMVGAAITPDGLFLTCAYEFGGAQPGDHLLALGSDGSIVQDLFLTGIGLNRDSGIAIDPSGQIYVSSPLGVHVIAPDFSTQALLPVSFGRAAGIAIDAQGELYIVDQANNQIVVLDPAYQLLRTIPTGPTPRQDVIGPDGYLYYTDDPYRTPDEYLSRLVQVDIGQDDAQTVVLRGLPFMNSITFAPDGSFYLGTANGRALSWYSSDGQLLSYVEHGSGIVDAVAYYPPDGGGGFAVRRGPHSHDAGLAGALAGLSGPARAEPGPGLSSQESDGRRAQEQLPGDEPALRGHTPREFVPDLQGHRVDDWLGGLGAEPRLPGPEDSIPVDGGEPVPGA
jgi:hypothetical protein